MENLATKRTLEMQSVTGQSSNNYTPVRICEVLVMFC